MTLGLAAGNAEGIFLAIESQGLPAAGPPLNHVLIASKIIELQTAPEVVALAAGGLEHWSYVATKYSKQSSVTAASTKVAQLLNDCMGPQNEAYGLICGFENGIPECYRIDRAQNQQATSRKESLTDIQSIGIPGHAKAARECAKNAIGNGIDGLLALVDAIQRRFPGEFIRPPVHVRVMRPSC